MLTDGKEWPATVRVVMLSFDRIRSTQVDLALRSSRLMTMVMRPEARTDMTESLAGSMKEQHHRQDKDHSQVAKCVHGHFVGI